MFLLFSGVVADKQSTRNNRINKIWKFGWPRRQLPQNQYYAQTLEKIKQNNRIVLKVYFTLRISLYINKNIKLVWWHEICWNVLNKITRKKKKEKMFGGNKSGARLTTARPVRPSVRPSDVWRKETAVKCVLLCRSENE